MCVCMCACVCAHVGADVHAHAWVCVCVYASWGKSYWIFWDSTDYILFMSGMASCLTDLGQLLTTA